jgi:hypothetical protein
VRLWVGAIVQDCRELGQILPFWRQALDYVPRDEPEPDGVVLTDPRRTGPNPNLSLNLTTEPPFRLDRLRLVLGSEDRTPTVERVLGLGARTAGVVTGGRTILDDPEGHPFELVDATHNDLAPGRTAICGVTLDCRSLPTSTAFWAGTLGFVAPDPIPAGRVLLRDPRSLSPFLELRRTESALPDDYRLHLDLYSSDLAYDVERVQALGATLVRPRQAKEDFVTLLDPDGTPFDVIDKSGWAFGRRA